MPMAPLQSPGACAPARVGAPSATTPDDFYLSAWCAGLLPVSSIFQAGTALTSLAYLGDLDGGGRGALGRFWRRADFRTLKNRRVARLAPGGSRGRQGRDFQLKHFSRQCGQLHQRGLPILCGAAAWPRRSVSVICPAGSGLKAWSNSAVVSDSPRPMSPASR